MKNPADIIVELESYNSRIFKENVILQEMEKNNDMFFLGISYALNPLITFGVKQVPEKKTDNENTLDFHHFIESINLLKSRKVTGNAAKDLLKDLMDKSSLHLWNNWYRRILLKDLKCGVSEKTINNCAKKFPQYKIPIFSCQLASPSEDHQKKLIGKKIVDCKMDGSRLLSIVYPEGNVDMFSRNGKEIVNFPKIKSQLEKSAHLLSEPMVFDGELMSSSFQDLMTMFFRKTNVNTDDSVLYLFDMIPLKDFSTGFYGTKQINRSENLQNWYSNMENVKLMEYKVLDFSDEHDLEEFKTLNKFMIDNGYEGIMIKDINAPYECKRTSSWLKVKPILGFDLEILDLEEGDGKYTDMLGALVCYGIDDGKEIFVNVGSGLTDELRMEYWQNKDKLIGKIVEIEADAITQNADGKYSLRFPRFKRIRGFEIGEKL